MILLAVFGFLINGTYKSPLMLIVILFSFVVLKLRIKYYYIIILSFLLVLSVVIATFLTSNVIDGFETGNYLRVKAWTNAIYFIFENPLLGTHIFKKGLSDEFGIDAIMNYGIAESHYLQIALDFGILPSFLILLTLTFILKINILNFYSNKIRSNVPASLAIIIFVDSFFGTFFGSVLTTFVFAMVCFSWKD
jgi:hypothetical protein